MSTTCCRRLIAHASEWDSRRRTWRRIDRPKVARQSDRAHGRDALCKQFVALQVVGLVLLWVMAAWLSTQRMRLDIVILEVLLCGHAVLLINPCRLVTVLADVARFTRAFLGKDQSPQARLRRSATASELAIAAVVASACVSLQLARQATHRLAVRLRAALGTTMSMAHPRLAATTAAAVETPKRS